MDFYTSVGLRILAVGLTVPLSLGLCWRTFSKGAADAADAKRWIMWLKASIVTFLLAGIFNIVYLAVSMSREYSILYLIVMFFASTLHYQAFIFGFLSLVEAAYFLARTRNKGSPVKHSGWSRILAFVLAGLFSIANISSTISYLVLMTNTSAAPRNYVWVLDVVIIALLLGLFLVSLVLLGLAIALMAKTKSTPHLRPAAGLFLIAAILFDLPFLVRVIYLIIQITARLDGEGWDKTEMAISLLATYFFWLPFSACLCALYRLRSRRVGKTDHQKVPQSV